MSKLGSYIIFEFQLDLGPSFKSYKNKMFFTCDGNHKFFAWKNYIDCMHTDDYSCHVFVYYILYAYQPDNILNLLTAM